jgi:membrane carboxypeptidase/penicillin-binding protein
MNGLVSGITGAAPIWHDLMSHLLEGRTAQKPIQPGNVISRIICSDSGLIPQAGGDTCPTRSEYFIKGMEPKQLDPGRQKIFWDKVANVPAKAGQTENVEERMERVITDPLGNRYCVTCPHPSPTPTP